MDNTLSALEKEISDARDTMIEVEDSTKERSEKIAQQLQQHVQEYDKTRKDFIKTLNQEEQADQVKFYTQKRQEANALRKWRLRALAVLGTQHKEPDNPEALFNNPQQSKVLREVIAAFDKNAEEEEEEVQTKKRPQIWKNLIIPWSEIAIVKKDQHRDKLGEGAFGVVYRGMCNGSEVAVKELKSETLTEKAKQDFERECALLSTIEHEHILRFMGACIENGRYALLTELAERGSLEDVLNTHNRPLKPRELPIKLSFMRKMQIAKEIALGMNFLHKRVPPLLHLDLKSANVLLDEDWHVRIADFGMSHIKNFSEFVFVPPGQRIGGTPLYMAPEILQSALGSVVSVSPTEKCDVFSYGILLWELLCEKVPYDNKYKTLEAFAKAVTEGTRPVVPDNCPANLKTLIENCWSKSQEGRQSFEEMVEANPWKEIILEAISKGSKNAMSFWRSFGSGDERAVPWTDFYKKFAERFSVPGLTEGTPQFQALRAVLDVDEQAQNYVTIEKWHRFVAWFGPLASNGNQVLAQVVDLLQRDWFFGSLSKEDAELKLCVQKPGTYLVRFSAQEGLFSISWIGEESKNGTIFIQHARFEDSSVQLVHQVEAFTKEKKFKRVCADRPAKYVNLNIKPISQSGSYRALNTKDFLAGLSEEQYAALIDGKAKKKKDEVELTSSWNVGEVNFVV